MITRHHPSSRIWRSLVIAAAFVVVLAAVAVCEEKKADEPTKTQIHVDNWLLLGPVTCPLPAFSDEGKSKTKPADVLAYNHLTGEHVRPVVDSKVNLIGGGMTTWTEAVAGTLGVELPADTSLPRIAYLATYVEVPRWMKIDVTARSTHPFEVTIDGKSVITDKEGGAMAKPDDKKKGEAKLEKGKHVLVAKTVFVPGDTIADWRFDATVSGGKNFETDPVLSTDPSRVMDIGHVLDIPMMGGIEVSPNGALFVMSVSTRTPPEGDTESRMEIRRTTDGNLVRTLKDMSNVSNRQWAPTGNRLSYVVREDGSGTVRVMDLDTGEVETIVEGVKDFSSYSWSPDGSFIAYSVDVKPEEDKTGIKRMQGVSDRRHDNRDKTTLYLSSVPSGFTRPLAAGEHGAFVYDIHPDCRSMLVGRYYEELSERPYALSELVLLDLDDQSTEVLWKGRWLQGARWSPDGKIILITAGPSAFGKIGQNVPEGVTPNDYDTQAYLFDAATKKVEAITRDFDPSIESVFWTKPGGEIFMVASDGEYVRFFRYSVKNKTFKRVDVGCDVIRGGDVARDKPVAVVTGSGANYPARLFAVDLKSGKAKLLLDPAADTFEHVKMSEVEDWNFTTSGGKEIVGRIHFPPDFDASKKWPCIVYYYGGTSPVDRTFGGRYPKNLWAAAGYVVYVLQPSGATGFGQEFSALHVNDWGKIVAGEIIEGTEKFLAAHDFVDPDRVGCIGASYGGFMTQLLITKTDIFAAAVSHAGISSIQSYWGEGYWGYQYNAVSAANSFPWNRRDIYIDQSPLNAADKVNTPLLLLHGGADTNVPPGESEQMYTALKLLGKEVEYIKVADQNHFILDYKKRILWSNAILAWFDKWLKDEPEWWDDMYPPIDAENDE